MAQKFRRDPLSYEPNDEVAGRYRVTGTLGKGGFGAVYAAEHTGTHQAVALKVLTIDPSTSDDDVVRRFTREARITAQLRSHHTVRVFDVGEIEDGPMFMAMELLKGPELEKVLRTYKKAGGLMPEAEAIEIGLQVLKSLGEAHKKGLVHRDLKPANIMLADMGEDEPVVKVLDFGIARTEDSSLTGDGKALGTPAYMSPEQCMARDLDGRSDLYSLAVVLFRCVTGKLPFESRNPLALLNLHLREPAPDPRSINPNVSPAMAEVLLRAMEKEPEARYADAREMRQALQGVLGGAWAETPAVPMSVVEGSPDDAPTVSLATPGPRTAPSLSAVLKIGDEDLMAQATKALDAVTQAANDSRSTSAVSSGSAAEAGGKPSRWPLWLGLGALLCVGAAGAVVALSPAEAPAPKPTAGVVAQPDPAQPGPRAAGKGEGAAAAVKGAAPAGSAAVVDSKKDTERRIAQAKAKANRQLAEASKDLATKVKLLKEAKALDPDDKVTAVMLAEFEGALAKQEAAKAAAAKAAAEQEAARAAAAKAAKAARRAKAAKKKPAAKPAPRRAAKKPAAPAKKTQAVAIPALD